MYAFHHRGDTEVVDEPLYAYYLQETGLEHPGREEILASQSTDFHVVLQDISREPTPFAYRFVKNMAHHLPEDEWEFLQDFVNILLIRDPKQLIASFAEVFPNPTMRDIGVQRQHEIFHQLRDWGAKPLVIDSGELLKDPSRFMPLLCEKLPIPYYDSMIAWPAGPIKADGVWSKYWYKNVHASTGLHPQTTSSRPLPRNCEALYAESLPYYEELSKYALRI